MAVETIGNMNGQFLSNSREILRATQIAIGVMGIVAPAAADEQDMRSCAVLEGGKSVEVIGADGPETLTWRYAVFIRDGRVSTLIAEGGGFEPGAYGFKPGQAAVSFRQDSNCAGGKGATVVERAEVFPGGRVIVETWRTWCELSKQEHERLAGC